MMHLENLAIMAGIQHHKLYMKKVEILVNRHTRLTEGNLPNNLPWEGCEKRATLTQKT
jgi:hypothetical protein